MVAALGPRVREEDPDPGQRGFRHLLGQQRDGVAAQHDQVGQLRGPHEQRRDPGLEDLDGEVVDVGLGRRQRGRRLAHARADLQDQRGVPAEPGGRVVVEGSVDRSATSCPRTGHHRSHAARLAVGQAGAVVDEARDRPVRAQPPAGGAAAHRTSRRAACRGRSPRGRTASAVTTAAADDHVPLPQLAEDRRGEDLGDVVALGGQRVVGADELRHRRLGQALRPAAPPQVGPFDAVVADAVVDLGARLEHDPDLLARAGPGLAGADAELGLLAAQRVLADAADLLGEAADALEDLAPERHVAAHEVAHLGPRGGLAGVGAADDPVELAGGVAVGRVRAGEHVRAAAAVGPGRPARVGHAADGLHGDVLVGLEQRGEPAGAGAGVVVEEDHDVALGLGDGGVAGAGQALDVRVGQHPHVR